MQLNADGNEASRILKARREEIAGRVTNLFFEARPQLEERWKGARRKCSQDNGLHLDYLGEALSFGHPELFTEYATWAATLLSRLKIPGEELVLNLTLLGSVLSSELEGKPKTLASRYLEEAIRTIRGAGHDLPSYLEGNGALDEMARDFLAALLRGDRHYANSLILTAVDGGVSVADVYLQVFQRVLQEVGRLWHNNEIGVAQEHYCTACIQMVMSQLYPRIFSHQRNGFRLVATCVGGDLHEIGVRMVSDFFEMAGWDTFYLGSNVPLTATVQQVVERAPQVLGISATMSTHTGAVADLIAMTRAIENGPRILVGGAPFNSIPDLWRDVGADGYARDAADAVVLVTEWVA